MKGHHERNKPGNDVETQKPFSQSINYVIILCFFIGLNLGGNGKFNVIYNVMCGHQLLSTALVIPYAVLKSELTSDDTQKLVASLNHVVAAIFVFLLNFKFRTSVDSLVIFIKRADLVLMRLEGEQRRPLLDKLGKMKPVFLIMPVSVLIVFYYQIFGKLLSNEVHIQVGNERFRQLSQQYNLQLIQNVSIPIATFAATLIAVTFVPVFLLLHFIFDHFAKSNTSHVWSPSTDDRHRDHSVNDFIKLFGIHREACGLLRLANEAFGPVFAIGLSLLTFNMISNARLLFVFGQSIGWGTLAVVITNLGWVLFIIMLNSKINKMFEVSMSHLVQIGLQLRIDGKLSARKSFALSAILDLYVTYVQLDSPAMSMGGFIKLRPQLLVQVCGIVLSYTIFLYSK